MGLKLNRLMKSHPARGAWIEIDKALMQYDGTESHPARGAWIEINTGAWLWMRMVVAPRKGCVD